MGIKPAGISERRIYLFSATERYSLYTEHYRKDTLGARLDNQITVPQVYRAIVLKLTEQRKYYWNSIPAQDLWVISSYLGPFQRCLYTLSEFISLG